MSDYDRNKRIVFNILSGVRLRVHDSNKVCMSCMRIHRSQWDGILEYVRENCLEGWEAFIINDRGTIVMRKIPENRDPVMRDVS